MNKINWNEIETNIKKNKYPLSFLYNILHYSKKINDKNLSLIIRFFFKYHYIIAIDHYLIDLVFLLENDKIITKKIIYDFYNLINKKIDIAKSLIKFEKSYKKNNFWNKSIINQINTLENIKMIFYSNFDVCKSSTFFHKKIYNILLFNKDDKFNLNHLIKRLRNIFLLFNKKFFTEYNVILIKKNKFITFELKDKMKYCNYIFQKISKILLDTTHLFKIYNYTNNQLNNIINPIPIVFKKKSIFYDLKYEDILFMIKN
jgi:hypothetical protein